MLESLTKKQAIAAMAMQGLLANPDSATVSTNYVLKILGLPPETTYNPETHWPKYIAALSYQMAEALFQEFEKH